MKLYTEEQVRKMLFDLGDVLFNNNQNGIKDGEPEEYFNRIIEEYTLIKLPSDEEIDNHVEDDFLNSTEVHKYSEETQLLMKAMCKAGALWIRDKIQADNKKVEIVQGGFCTTNVVNN